MLQPVEQTLDAAALCDILTTLQAERSRIDTEIRNIKAELATTLGHREEGQVTHDLGDYKVSITQPINRKVDIAAMKEARIPEAIRDRLFPVKYSVSVAQYHYLENNEPELFAEAQRCITETAGTVQVEVKRAAS